LTAVFTDFFRTLLYNSLDKVAPLDPQINLFNPAKSLHWVFFRSHAAFTDANDPRYTGIKNVSELSGLAGWSAPLTPNSLTHTVGTTTGGTTTYCLDNAKYAMGNGWVPSTVTAAALVLEGSYTAGATVTDPIIYLTDTPFQGGVVMGPGDTLWARPVPAIAGNRSLFSWPVWFTGQTQVQPLEGSVAVSLGPPTFEAAYTHHAWIYPQRINMIANPSFELGLNHWRSNGTITRVLGTTNLPVAPGGTEQNTHYGRIVGAAPLRAESNFFPLSHQSSVGDMWTIQAMVRGTGRLRVGLVGWDPTFVQASADWGDRGDLYREEWPLSPTSYTHVYALRHASESTTGLVRFECTGGEMHLDNVLCEADWLKDWRYFDGDSTFGARDDHSWYGGASRQGQTYSCFYNHRRAVVGRLFAWDIEADDFTITDEEVEAQGFVYKWVPAGVRVAAHLDVLWPDDIQEAVPDNAGTAVTPYNNGTNGGVTSPWTVLLAGGSKGAATTRGVLR
jgi:hypothetical protein